ncbi:MAG: AraC-like DNA-binding protein [Saprospiraceae bacterium]|jgi:AraC-like DNA-binding protein
MFFILGISIAVFLVFLLLIKKNKSHADQILMAWLLLMVIHQLLHYGLYTDELYNYPHLLGLEFPMPILQGVFLYFYVLAITGKKVIGSWSALVHLIPALALVILAIPFYTLSGEEKINVFKTDAAGYEWFVIIEGVLMTVSGLAYSAFSLIRIKKHHLNIQENFSNTEKKELQWLQYLSIGLGMIWFVAIFFDGTVIFSAVVIFVLFIGFFGINQMNIFYSNQIPDVVSNEEPDKRIEMKTSPLIATTKRYAKSGLNKESAEQLYAKLNELMAKESLFINNDLTLTELAKRLDVHSNYLSQVINGKEQKNFYNYINALRIKEFIRLSALPENKKYTLLSLAFDCGFNSKSTFNKHFKENMGKTPTEYFKD